MNIKTLSIRNVLAVAVVGVLIGVAYITNPALFNASKVEAGTGQNVSGWAWSENIGWISFNSTNESSGAPYGVNVDTSTKSAGGIGNFSGYAWADSIGWISFNSADTSSCPTAPCQAQVNWSTGAVTGWARALANGGGWDGWIKLSKGTGDTGPAYGVTISGNNFSGYAWGSDAVGWVDLGPYVNSVFVGVHVAPALSCEVTTTSWGTCQTSAQCTNPPAEKDVLGTQTGIDNCGYTHNQSCTVTLTCRTTGSFKPKYKQF